MRRSHADEMHAHLGTLAERVARTPPDGAPHRLLERRVVRAAPGLAQGVRGGVAQVVERFLVLLRQARGGA